jgi:hypothetical protein
MHAPQRRLPNSISLKLSTVAIAGVVIAAAGIGVYKLGHAADANQMFTVVSIPQQASVATAESNLAGAVSAANSYKLDNSGYTGMSASGLKRYDSALGGGIVVKSATAAAYCIESTIGTTTVSIRGPNGSFVVGTCASHG